MKKTVLILLSFLCFSSVYAQEGQDSAAYLPKWNSVRFFASAMPGFQVYTNDKATITLALSFGASYRHYFKHWPKMFYDADLSSTQMILNGQSHESFVKGCVGLGRISRSYNVQLHAAYAQNFTTSGANLVGLGYDVEAASIPITIDFLHFTNNSQYLYMVGIKVPLFADWNF